jgi:trimethylamine---corrinoid protein Co-methyltransferase
MDDAIRDLWPPEAIEAIHATSVTLLGRVGVRVESPAAREILERAGCGSGPGGRLTIPRQLVEEAIAAGRRRYTLVARDAERSLEIDPEPAQIYVHNMGGARDIADARSGTSRRALVADQADLARVMHHLVNQHTICPMVQPDDVPDALEPLYSYLMVAFESDKYIGGPGISHAFQARHLVEMAVAVAGQSAADGRYPLDLAFSPVSPLLLGAEVTDALVDSVGRGGIVCEILPCPLAGTTAPAPLSAALALQNAEVLAGLVLVQTVSEGTPCYYGPRLSSIDPRSGAITSGAVETGGASIPAVLLARRYGMACDCYGPSTDSRVADAQFGIEHALNALLGMIARPRFLSGVGDLQAGAATAVEALVIDDEILNYAFQALAPRSFDREALDVEAITEGVLSGKGFLGTKHTRRYLRSEYGSALLAFRGGAEEWSASGRGGMVDAAAEKAAESLAVPPVGLPDDVAEVLCSQIDACAAELGLAEWPDPRRLLAARVE